MHLFRMFRNPVAMPLLGPEDGAAGGAADGADAGDPGYQPGLEADGDIDGATGDDGGDPDGADAGAGGDDDEDDVDLLAGGDDDDLDPNQPIDEKKFRKVVRELRRAKRRIAKQLPLTQRLRGVDVDRVIANARQYEALEQRLRSNPRLLQQLMHGAEGDDDTGGQPASRRAPSQTDPEWLQDDDKFPFDVTTPSGKFFAQQMRSMYTANATVQSDLRRALKRIETLEGGIQQERTQQVRSKWVEGMEAAARQIKDPNLRDMFKDAVRGAFHYAQSNGQRLDPNKVIGHYLKKAGVNPTTQRIAAGAARQRMAQSNQQLPRHQAGGGVATPARSGKERLADVHKRLRQIGG